MSTLTITTVQTQLHWEDKEANLRSLEEKITAVAGKTELLILPEMFSTGFSMQPEKLAEKMDGPTIRWMKNMAANAKMIITGSIIIEESGNYFNRLIWMLPTGELGCYDKRHLFAYGGEHEKYTAGSSRLVASVKGWKINLLVCYDLRFPVWSRQSRSNVTANSERPEFDLLVYVANWPERRKVAWKTLLQARAIENQCFVAGVNRVGKDGNDIYHSGDSMVIDPLGEILYHQPHLEEVFTYTLKKESLDDVQTKFPFWKDADVFFIEP